MWHDFFRIFQYAFSSDPISKKDREGFSGAGTPQPDAMPDLRAVGGGAGGNAIPVRDTNEFVDLSTVTNRKHRYKEYERLRSMPEIEMAMTVFADEACLAGDTLIVTPTYGMKPISWLAENMQERFLVYCWDFNKNDFTLGWAFNPRKTKTSKTIKIVFDNGESVICTGDHRILNDKAQWIEAQNYKCGESVMAFQYILAKQSLTNQKTNQFPRILTEKGWVHERQFINEWRVGKTLHEYDEVNSLCRQIIGGVTVRKIAENQYKGDAKKVKNLIENAGWSYKELNYLAKQGSSRRIIGIHPGPEIDVYDLSVEGHENFCTNWGVVHNCQKDEFGKVFEITCKDDSVKDELEFLLFHRKMLNLDQKKIWNKAKHLFINGDLFEEIIIDTENPKHGIKGLAQLPVDTMYRIETTKGRLLEFQQSKEGPDYQSLANIDVTQARDSDLAQATAIRFTPEQVVHTKIGDDRTSFYPYGVSLIEPARGPAHQLRLMEDAMLVYRLSRSPERRMFYVDVHQLPSARAEALVERMKSQFKKRKTTSNRGSGGLGGASAVEERWQAPAIDEDFWIPIRGGNDNTRVETLPGAQNLDQIADTQYFRDKVFIALNFPKNYFNSDDVQGTRISLSAQDVKFARLVERLQSYIEDSLWSICDRHLKLRGVPEEVYEDLEIKMTPPSDWRELSRAEVISTRIQNAGSLKGSQLMSDYDILTGTLHLSEEETKKMLARNKIQKLEELKMQIVAQNPALLGVGVPGDNEEHINTEPSEQNPMLGDTPPSPEMNDPGMNEPMDQEMPEQGQKNQPLVPEPSDEDIKKYNLDIKDYARDQDQEEIDYSQG